ncbi:hypothetical protein [Saccharothrix sp. HUAS TT1]|uniref:hypothetical protein n=1 Tax=unclassified Saccharothrix TaxID=2593673 RepID=UPI00345C0A57
MSTADTELEIRDDEQPDEVTADALRHFARRTRRVCHELRISTDADFDANPEHFTDTLPRVLEAESQILVIDGAQAYLDYLHGVTPEHPEGLPNSLCGCRTGAAELPTLFPSTPAAPPAVYPI